MDLGLAAARACWKLATVAVRSGTGHPWPSSATVDDLAEAFYGLLPSDVLPNLKPADQLAAMRAAEAELRRTALGGDVDTHLVQLRFAGRRSLDDRSVGAGPPTGLRTRLTRLRRLPVVGPLLVAVGRRLLGGRT